MAIGGGSRSGFIGRRGRTAGPIGRSKAMGQSAISPGSNKCKVYYPTTTSTVPPATTTTTS